MKDSNNSKQFMKMNSTVSDVLEEEEEKGATSSNKIYVYRNIKQTQSILLTQYHKIPKLMQL